MRRVTITAVQQLRVTLLQGSRRGWDKKWAGFSMSGVADCFQGYIYTRIINELVEKNDEGRSRGGTVGAAGCTQLHRRQVGRVIAGDVLLYKIFGNDLKALSLA